MNEDHAAPASAEQQALDAAFATVVFGADGLARRGNAGFLRLFGGTARELVGRPLHSFFVSVDGGAGAIRSTWPKRLHRGRPIAGRWSCRRSDGTVVRIDATCVPVVDGNGRLAEVVIFARDVTAEALRAAADRGVRAAIEASHATVEFTLDGSVVTANARFLAMTGYTLEEIRGRSHRFLLAPADAADTAGEAAFWRELAKGRSHDGSYRRTDRHGRELWWRGAYHPIHDPEGRPFKVVLHATDATAERHRRSDLEGQIAAIDASHGMITFDLDGTVLDANTIFLEATGYRFEEIEGRHHRMFVEPSYAHGAEYAAFWNHLVEGRHQSGEYRRFGKHGRELWLQASYNPIRDADGRLTKIVKITTVTTREKLRQADHQGQIASIHKVQSVISFDLHGRILDANDNFLDITGYRLSELRGRHHRTLVDRATAESEAYRAFWDDLSRGRHRAGEFKRIGKDGREIWLQASYNPIFDMGGRPFKIVKYATDVTVERLRQLDAEGQIAAIHASQCVVAYGLDGRVIEANDNFLAAMRASREQVVGREHRSFFGPEVAAARETEENDAWATLRAGRFVSGRFCFVGTAGQDVWLEASYNPILDLDGRPIKVIQIATDVSASVALAAQVVRVREEAEHDATTGLPNRRGLAAFMHRALSGGGEGAGTGGVERLAILYLDLDHFKPINDTFGHAVGDRVLRETADRLRRALRPHDLVARLGGDEFIVAAPGLSDEAIGALCARLLEVVKAPIRHEQCTLAVGLSIGVAVAPGDATTADDLLRCADIALYRTKGNGRDGYSCFAASMHERLSAGRYLAGEMRHGIQAGQFFLEFAPWIDVATQRIDSLQATIRWNHPERGRLEEGDFLRLAEKSALILPLGDRMLREACRTAAGVATGRGVVVAISPVHIAGADLAASVGAALADAGLAPERLTISLAERAWLDDADAMVARVAGLKALGVRLRIVGSHASARTSLASIRALGFDEVEVDRRFVADIEAEEGRTLARELRRIDEAFGAVPAHGPIAAATSCGRSLVLRLGATTTATTVHGFIVGTPVPFEFAFVGDTEGRPTAPAGTTACVLAPA